MNREIIQQLLSEMQEVFAESFEGRAERRGMEEKYY